MRDWNNDLLKQLCSFSSTFWSYLWGIEIPVLSYYPYFRLCVLILPMRDWNSALNEEVTNVGTRFDLTYEGLKSESWNGYDVPVVVLILPMRDWNYSSWISFKPLISVLILPMRDWNILQSWHSRRRTLFWSYLWGIETFLSFFTLQCFFRVLILPMRDWNNIVYPPLT